MTTLGNGEASSRNILVALLIKISISVLKANNSFFLFSSIQS